MNDEQLELYESYLDKGFNEDQLYEIKKGIEEGNDVSAFARLKMPASEMAHTPNISTLSFPIGTANILLFG